MNTERCCLKFCNINKTDMGESNKIQAKMARSMKKNQLRQNALQGKITKSFDNLNICTEQHFIIDEEVLEEAKEADPAEQIKTKVRQLSLKESKKISDSESSNMQFQRIISTQHSTNDASMLLTSNVQNQNDKLADN